MKRHRFRYCHWKAKALVSGLNSHIRVPLYRTLNIRPHHCLIAADPITGGANCPLRKGSLEWWCRLLSIFPNKTEVRLLETSQFPGQFTRSLRPDLHLCYVTYVLFCFSDLQAATDTQLWINSCTPVCRHCWSYRGCNGPAQWPMQKLFYKLVQLK